MPGLGEGEGAIEGEGERAPRSQREPDEAPATRGEVLATLGILGVMIGVAAWDPLSRRVSAHPSAEECAALLDRYVEHVAYAVDPSPASSALSSRRALAKEAAQARGAFARCERELTRAEVDCAMKATYGDAFERCLP